ncbi:MAG: acetyl-CoA carboxylase carboxyl transferase subunit alpha [Melioribacteraceae bacterium]|nr:acetyl-CoA carboxylase carboxyl transferase subunit alpha [Melioribacteraceae bacterium]
MVKNSLDFEKPIIELENKINEMRQYEGDLDIKEEVEKLEEKVVSLKKNIFQNLTRWQRVQLARHPERPYTLDYINFITTDFVELHGDRHFGDDKAIVSGFAKIDGHKVMIIGHQKGRDTKSNVYRNFGMPNPEGYRKALRLMKLAEKFNVPVITLLDTPGAFPGLEAEERGQAEAIARNLFEMSKLRVPIIVVIIGEGASGGALGIRNWRQNFDVGKHLVFCYFSRILFLYFMEKLGLQRAGSRSVETNSRRSSCAKNH